MTTLSTPSALTEFQWTPQPQAEALVIGLVEQFLNANAFARELKRRLYDEAGVRFVDLVDSLHWPDSASLRANLASAGYRKEQDGETTYAQNEGIFPRVVLRTGPPTIYLKVESVADFLSVWQIHRPIDGIPLATLRTALVAAEADAHLMIIERHGSNSFESRPAGGDEVISILSHAESFRRRRRTFESAVDGFQEAHRLIDAAIIDLGVSRTCDLFFAAEREYWQRRNRAGQIQKTRQDRLGIGWGNHDHHTYRSSREYFAALIGVLEKLGFHCRERFYAGAQAGWGAQVLEQPEAGIVIFADVDMSPDELLSDFSHDGLAPREALGTVGLWCALHGEAFLEAGMHHLECQFDFDALKTQLESQEGVNVMKPFTNFPYLRQAFTQAEIWSVRPERIEKLLSAGRITPEQAVQFREKGALGSHLENLERNQGFKGFNQTGVSEIIARTDPRSAGPF